MSDNRSSLSTVVAALIIGAAAGAAVALLFAPATGEETRRKLMEKARAGRDRVDEMAREGREFFDRRRENADQARKEKV